VGAQAGRDRLVQRARPHGGREKVPILIQPGPLLQETESFGGRSQLSGHHHQIPGLRPRAQERPAALSDQGDVDDDRGRAARDVAPDDADPGLGRPLQQPVVEGVHPGELQVPRQAEAHDRVAADAAHRRHIRQVHGQGLAPQEAGRGGLAPEVHALHQAVRGHEGGRAELDEGGVVPDPHRDRRGPGDARLQPSEQLPLADVADSRGLVGQG
jgi:hypothetical protein